MSLRNSSHTHCDPAWVLRRGYRKACGPWYDEGVNQPVSDSVALDQLAKEELERVKDLDVLEGLSADQRRRLGQILVHGSAHHALEPDDSPRLDQLIRYHNKRGPAQIREVQRNLAKVRKALNRLQTHATTIGNVKAQEGNTILATQLLDSFWPHVQAATSAINDVTLPEVDEAGSLSPSESVKTRMVVDDRLQKFFVEECHLPHNEADLRIAKIGNALWDWSVRLREYSDNSDQWRGSDAIRKRRTRRSPAKVPKAPGTPQK